MEKLGTETQEYDPFFIGYDGLGEPGYKWQRWRFSDYLRVADSSITALSIPSYFHDLILQAAGRIEILEELLGCDTMWLPAEPYAYYPNEEEDMAVGTTKVGERSPQAHSNPHQQTMHFDNQSDAQTVRNETHLEELSTKIHALGDLAMNLQNNLADKLDGIFGCSDNKVATPDAPQVNPSTTLAQVYDAVERADHQLNRLRVQVERFLDENL